LGEAQYVSNLYERGHRDGERGLDPRNFADAPAHDLWHTHVAYHAEEQPWSVDGCGLDCIGLTTLDEDVRKQRRQVPDGLPNTRHICPECGAVFRSENRAAEREQYTAGYEAGRSQRAAGQQRRRNDQARRARRRH
jgi:uncharacterized C2H2 Zn-finger protein